MTERSLPPSTQAAILNRPLPALYPSLSTSPLDTSTSIPPLPTASPTTVSPSIAAAAGDTSITSVVSTALRDDAPAAKTEPVSEEEPYTIKCICGFTGDDGNTIYCEICDSWQHIECFYPNNSEEATREEFAHACHECKPRPLNVAHAVEYQQQRLHAASAEASANHLKPKRPPSKNNNPSHRRKPKPGDLVGIGHGAPAGDNQRYPNASANDPNSGQHPHHPNHAPKRSKSSHKASQSLGGGASHTKRSPSYSASRASVQQGHPLSPATTPPDLPDGIEIHNYSSDFLSRCNNQDLVRDVQTNSFASLAVSNTTSVWLREPKRMLRETGHEYADVFQALPADMDSCKCSPRIDITTRILGQDTAIRWRYLSAPEPIDKDVPLMELNGQVGFQKDYCAVPSNRYEELSCPLPFVFFHPVLPLYIDTRTEGSLARYVRRSCRPNTILDTFLSGGSEYHFWLVSDRHIDADEQITIPWDFRLPLEAKGRMLRLLGLRDDDTTSHDDLDVGEEEYNSIARWVYLILSEYGGCACDLGNECAFARFHRTYGNRAQQARALPTGSKKKSSRKPRPHVLSPTSTGHTTNSRAASEGRADDYPENDKLSASSRSKPSSRDMTPAPRQGSFDTLGILTEPTDRDKRKVAMVEDSFRRLEQHGPRPKKKRASDGAVSGEKYSATPSKSKAKTTSPSIRSLNHSDDHSDFANGSASHRYVDASSSSRGKSGSPASSVPPGMSGGGHNHVFTSTAAGFASTSIASGHHASGPSAGYCDATIQTDPMEDEWFSTNSPPPRRIRKVIPLARRLLNNRQRARSGEFSDTKQQTPQPSTSTVMDVDTHPSSEVSDGRPPDTVVAAAKQESTEGSALDTTMDTPMLDAPAAPLSISSPALPSDENSTPKSPSTMDVSKTDAVPKEEAGEDIGDTKPVDANSPAKKSPDLHLQLPKIPTLGDLPTASNGATPLVASSITQSPFSITNTNPFGSPLAAPSPIKKKLSLSDYKSRNTKSRKAGAGQPGTGSTLKPPAGSGDEPKLATNAGDADGIESQTVTEQTSEAPSSTA